MATLELNDIQGIIRTGYGIMEAACFVILEIKDPSAAKRWLKGLELRDGINKADKNTKECINIAFTYKGLEQLGLNQILIEGFSREFQEGMTGGNRPDILGDHGESDPEKWVWGGIDKNNPKNQTRVHLLLMLYAPNNNDLDKLYRAQKELFAKHGLVQLEKLETILLDKRKEHFGFRDGIAQPEIAGKYGDISTDSSKNVLLEGGSSDNIIAAGEFILGYKNIYKKYTSSPTVPADKDPEQLLAQMPAELDQQDLRDFGRNGSYLVFRQLSQDVHKFWNFLDEATKDPEGSDNSQARVKLASKMVGRWPSGAPLVKHPNYDPHQDKQDEELRELDKPNDDFNFNQEDRFGEGCPLGSHIRRANPRDSLATQSIDPRQPFVSEPADPVDAEKRRATALSNANRHRIVRRGRAYGKPLADSMAPQDILDAAPTGEERGLQFLCFNANLARQFEFIQHTWINNPKFHGLYSEADPLLGVDHPKSVQRGLFGDFTVPAEPIRQRVSGLTRFVHVRGGAYFFIPSLRAVKYLASLE